MSDNNNEWGWTKDWEDLYANLSEEEKKTHRQALYDIRLHELEIINDREQFYTLVSNLIKHVKDFNDEQVLKLSKIVKHEWRPKRGAGTKDERDHEIWMYWKTMNTDGRSISRQEMLDYIIKKYKLTLDAAIKIFNKIK